MIYASAILFMIVFLMACEARAHVAPYLRRIEAEKNKALLEVGFYEDMIEDLVDVETERLRPVPLGVRTSDGWRRVPQRLNRGGEGGWREVHRRLNEGGER